jgi:hypothetical protein
MGLEGIFMEETSANTIAYVRKVQNEKFLEFTIRYSYFLTQKNMFDGVMALHTSN